MSSRRRHDEGDSDLTQEGQLQVAIATLTAICNKQQSRMGELVRVVEQLAAKMDSIEEKVDKLHTQEEAQKVHKAQLQFMDSTQKYVTDGLLLTYCSGHQGRW